MTQPNHNERPHAERSASQLGSDLLCPGYRPKPTKKVHWVTAQGTRGHEALDKGETEDLESTYEERMVKLCQEYSESLPFHTREFQEQRFDTLEGRWGYTDRLRIRGKLQNIGNCASQMADSDEADLLDWKFVRSKIVVDAEVNLQGKDYVVAIFEDPQFAFLNKIHVHFVMPRFESVTTATFTRADLPRLKLEILAVLARARETDREDYDGSTLTPRYEVCSYCGMAGNCVALRRIIDQLLRAYDPDGYGKELEIPTETHARNVTCPKQRAQLQRLAQLAEVFAKATRAHNLQLALGDETEAPDGYSIDWSKGRRRIVNTEQFETVAKEFGLRSTDIIDASRVTWGTLEELLRTRAAHGLKKNAVEDFERRLIETGAIERDEPTPKLVKKGETAGNTE